MRRSARAKVMLGLALFLAMPVAGYAAGQDSRPPLGSIPTARPAAVTVQRQQPLAPKPAMLSKPSQPRPHQVVPYQPIRSAAPARSSLKRPVSRTPQRPSPTPPRVGG